MSDQKQFDITFIPNGRGKAQCPSDPRFPTGVHVDMTGGGAVPGCHVDLPYPAPECGMFAVVCRFCKVTVAITSVGRPDDPVSAIIPCMGGIRHAAKDAS